MTHEQFLQMDRDPATAWGVRSLYRSARIVWGIGPELTLRAFAALILTPSLLLLGYCLWYERYAAAIWGLLALTAYRSGRSMSCSGGCLPVVLVPVGLGIALWTHSPLHALGGILPVATFFIAAMFKGSTVASMGPVLRESPEVFARMQDAGQMLYVRSANLNIDITPTSENVIEI